MLHMVYHRIHLSKPHIKLRIASAIEKKKKRPFKVQRMPSQPTRGATVLVRF